MAITDNWLVAAAMLAVVWFVTPMMQMAMRHYRMVAVEPSFVGRVANSTAFLSTVTSPFGPLISGFLFSAVGSSWAFVVYAAVALAVVVVAWNTGGFRGRTWTAQAS
jgi:hypothetical protein